MRPVLVVEDDPSTRQLITTCLVLDGLSVVTASNGREGLEQLRQSRPCVVLLDLIMPIMDGEQFRRAQLQDPALARVPTILISAQDDVVERGKALAVAAVIRKPFDIDVLQDVVGQYCPCDAERLSRVLPDAFEELG